MSSLSITDDDLYNSIINWGLPRKHKTYNLDSCTYLFNELSKTQHSKDFIRGFLDGDGCIYVAKNKYNHKITFTSVSKNFLISIDNCLIDNLNINKGYFQNITSKNKNYWTLMYSGGNRIPKILNWLYYPNVNLFLIRKREKWENLQWIYAGLHGKHQITNIT